LLEVKKAFQDTNLEVVGHTAYYLPFASPYESLRQAALEEMAWALDLFAQLGASRVTVHPDRSNPFALGSRGVLQKNLDAFAQVDRMASLHGIQVLIENMDRNFNTVEEFRETFSRFPQWGFHLDVGHANLNVERNRCEDFLKEFGDRLGHVHLSDNFGKSEDLHLPLGAGTIDWKKIIRLLKNSGYQGTMTLEIFSSDRRYLLLSRDKLRELWQS
jgi:sugar phosphate isomerase/epimerase